MMRGGSSDEDGEVDGDEDGGDASDEDGDVATNSCRPLLGDASGVISW